MSKFSLTKNTKEFFGTTLYQIKAEMSFGNVVKGELGGWIEKKENLSEEGDAWVFGDACVYGDAQVSGDAMVYGDARVYDDALVSGNAWVSGDARVSGNALVSGNARLELNAFYTQGWFVGGDDSGKITEITDKTGSTYWRKQYVLGDYNIEEENSQKTELLKKADELIAKAQELKDKANKL